MTGAHYAHSLATDVLWYGPRMFVSKVMRRNAVLKVNQYESELPCVAYPGTQSLVRNSRWPWLRDCPGPGNTRMRLKEKIHGNVGDARDHRRESKLRTLRATPAAPSSSLLQCVTNKREGGCAATFLQLRENKSHRKFRARRRCRWDDNEILSESIIIVQLLV